jgi:hypothetical protein
VTRPSATPLAPPQEPAAAGPPARPDLSARPPAADPLAAALAAPADPPARGARPAWMRPVAIGAGVLAAGLAGVAIQQGLGARHAYAEADAMVLPGGLLAPGVTAADRSAVVGRGDAASRNAWITGTGAAVSAAGAGLLWWLSR